MPSELLEKQWRFARMYALLILHAEQLGYKVTLGDTYRDPRVPYGHPKSTHRFRLAGDLNLFLPDGDYLSSGEEHDAIHDYWDLIGGAERITGDLNHYSCEWQGTR